MDEDPAMVTSVLSQELGEGGYLVEIQIYRLQEETNWTLGVVDEDGASHVWDHRFTTDLGAPVEAQKAIRTEGPKAFMTGDGTQTVH